EEDLLRGGGDRHQPRGALPADRHSRHRDRQSGTQRTLPGHVRALAALLERGAEDHVLDLAALDTGAFDGMLDHVPCQLLCLGVVERPAVGLADRRARRGNDDCFSHGSNLSVMSKMDSCSGLRSTGYIDDLTGDEAGALGCEEGCRVGDVLGFAGPGNGDLLDGGGHEVIEAHPHTFGGRLRHIGFDESDRKSTRLNSSHVSISYAVFCLKKKKTPILAESVQQRPHLPPRGATAFDERTPEVARLDTALLAAWTSSAEGEVGDGVAARLRR